MAFARVIRFALPQAQPAQTIRLKRGPTQTNRLAMHKARQRQTIEHSSRLRSEFGLFGDTGN
jgi:hypothetical protein